MSCMRLTRQAAVEQGQEGRYGETLCPETRPRRPNSLSTAKTCINEPEHRANLGDDLGDSHNRDQQASLISAFVDGS